MVGGWHSVGCRYSERLEHLQWKAVAGEVCSLLAEEQVRRLTPFLNSCLHFQVACG